MDNQKNFQNNNTNDIQNINQQNLNNNVNLNKDNDSLNENSNTNFAPNNNVQGNYQQPQTNTQPNQIFGEGQFGCVPLPPNATYNNNQPKKNKSKKGYFIASIILFIVGLVLSIISISITFELLETTNDVGFFAWLMLVFLGVGWVTYLPAFASLGVCIFTSIMAIQSDKRVFRIISIALLTLSIVCLVSILIFSTLIMFANPS